MGKGKYRSDFNWLFDLWGLVMKKIVFIGDHFRTMFEKIISPIGTFLARIGIPPNFISVIGLILSITAGLVYATGSFFWAAWVVVLAGLTICRRDTINVNERLGTRVFNIVNRVRWYIADLALTNI